MKTQNPHSRWKSVQYDYDALQDTDLDQTCLYCLSGRDVQLILASLDYFGWKTRYKSFSGTAIDQETIDNWQGHLSEVLMSCNSLRQDPDNPCQLQEIGEDGEWTTWANLRYCPPKLRLVGGTLVVELPDGTIVLPEQDDTYDGRTAPFTPPARGGTPDDNRCIAAANAVEVYYALHAQAISAVITPVVTVIALAIVTILAAILVLPVAIDIIISILLAGGGIAILSGLEVSDFDTATKQIFKCILYDNATDVSGVVTFDFTAVQAAVVSRISGVNIWAAIDLYLTITGESGLNRAGATTSITSADCSECGSLCYEMDFTASDFGGAAVPGFTGCVYTPGAGFSNSGIYGYTNINIGFVFTAFKIEYEFSLAGSVNPSNNCLFTATSGTIALVGCDTSPEPAVYTDGGGAPFSGDAIRLNPTNQTSGGVITIHKIRFFYNFGENPDWTPNCS